MKNLLGRASLLAALGKLLDEGNTVLLYGPVGAGKTSVLRALEARARSQKIPCAISPTTERLGDLTHALSRAYPSVDTHSGTTRHVRARLRNAVERRPGVLLLDHLGNTGTAFKGALKSIRGTGVGVVIAADVEQTRDHDRARGLRLAYREVMMPPLHGATIRTLLQALIAEAELPFELTDTDVRALAAATDGLPGRAVGFVASLSEPSAWSGGHPRCEWLRMESIIAAAERYRNVDGAVLDTIRSTRKKDHG